MKLLAVSYLLVIATVSAFRLETVSFQQLALADEIGDKVIAKALTEVGALLVDGIPGFLSARQQVLASSYECARSGVARADSKAFSYFTYVDGAERYSIGAKIEGHRENIEGVFIHGCEAFASHVEAFRDIVDSVTKLFVSRLDEIAGTDSTSKILFRPDSMEYYHNIRDMVEDGFQLEHFHTYSTKSPSYFSNGNTLDMHTDHGLFITVAPGMFLENLETDSDSFSIQLKSGETVKPNFGKGDVLLFMIGDGMKNYVNRVSKVQFRATPHSLKLPNDALRAWYGRMFLLSTNAMVQEETYGSHLNTVRNLKVDESYSLCSDGWEIQGRDLHETSTCADDEIWCWHRCQAIPNCTEDQAYGCVFNNSVDPLVLWDGATHNPLFRATCYNGTFAPTIGHDHDEPTASPTSNAVQLGSSALLAFCMMMFAIKMNV